MTQLHWLGHATFLIVTPSGKNIVIDPFLAQNPVTPQQWKFPEPLDYILLTHGHDDHTADAIPLANKTGARVISIVELSALLKKDGLPENQAIEMNKGGTLDLHDFKVTMTHAQHSSSWKGQYAGEPAGFIIELGDLRMYHTGDTNIMPDFAIYRDIYRPEIVMLPIGDHYTMGPEEAAHAAFLLEARYAIPMHYGTMPVLTGKPEIFQRMAEKKTSGKTRVLIPKPGEDIMQMII